MASTVWRGRLAFGMVAIPVRLYKAARRERLRFHKVYRQPARSPESEPLPEFEDKPVRAPETLRGYEVEKNRFVVVEPQEVQALRPATSTELDILEFVHLAEIDPIYFDASYYVAPDPGGEKAYALLF